VGVSKRSGTPNRSRCPEPRQDGSTARTAGIAGQCSLLLTLQMACCILTRLGKRPPHAANTWCLERRARYEGDQKGRHPRRNHRHAQPAVREVRPKPGL
jgi:hypothetical protein